MICDSAMNYFGATDAIVKFRAAIESQHKHHLKLYSVEFCHICFNDILSDICRYLNTNKPVGNNLI